MTIPNGVLSIEKLYNSMGSPPVYIQSLLNSAYRFDLDPQILARYRASDGLNDISPANVLGPLSATAGAVAAGVDADGNATWALRNATGGYLTTATLGTPIQNQNTVYLIAQAGPTPAVNQNWVNTGFSFVSYVSGAGLQLTAAASVGIPCTPASNNLIATYQHGGASRSSVNGSAPSATMACGINCGAINRVMLGAAVGGGNRADVNIAEVIIVEGAPSANFIAGLTAYVRSRYPSCGVSIVPPAQFSSWTGSLGGLITGPFDFAIMLGQSNNLGGEVQTGTLTPAGALGFLLGTDSVIKTCPLKYDDNASAVDSLMTDAIKLGGNGTAMIAAYTATSGRPFVLCPCAKGATQLRANWFPTLGRGNKQRDTLYGRALDRARNLLALGGVYRFTTWYQGESDIGGPNVSTYGADLNYMLTSFHADLGVPERTIIQPLAASVGGVGPADIVSINAQIASMGSANRKIGTPSNGPWEVDGTHLQATPQNAIGANYAALAIAAGWV